MRSQNTLARASEVHGVSFLRGHDVKLRFCPAPVDSGVFFVRTDLPAHPSVPARVEYVVPRERRTTIQRGEAVVEMVEHVLAALAGLQIDNCRIEIDAPESPGCDGSSLAFTKALRDAGIVRQGKERELLVIRSPITLKEGGSSLEARPSSEHRLALSYTLDYGHRSPIARQVHSVSLTPESFTDGLADCRTFLLAEEADALRKAGIGARTTTADVLVFGPDGPIENTLRHENEPARHKVLDMVGDLSLIGKDISGHVVAHRSGHQLNAALVRELLRLDGGVDSTEIAFREGGSELDVNQVMKILPHRYPFLLIDRVLELDASRRLLAIKNVSINEPFFIGHWPGRPIMPGVLILEALAQAAGILIGRKFDPTEFFAMLASMEDVKLRRPVTPGDQLLLEIDRFRIRSRLIEAYGVARVGNRLAAEARLRFALIPIEQVAA
jgi:UDP-3-O-[3-hydroxymyristoyl] N-acetylglucosamine deacetylase / 3-hydroxyacyl-[acyl-carrier-protein] dehydratase